MCIVDLFTETITTPVVTPLTPVCPKCGTTNDGKSSCCGRGGAWFGKCAKHIDAKFDHTWIEGLHICGREFVHGVGPGSSFEQNVSFSIQNARKPPSLSVTTSFSSTDDTDRSELTDLVELIIIFITVLIL